MASPSPLPPADSLPPEGAGFDDATNGALPPDGTDWALVRACGAEPQNDIGNSRRLRLRHGPNLLHIQNIGWHVYDGKRWKEDIDAAGTRPVCHDTVEAIALEAYILEPTEREAADIEAAEMARQSRADLKSSPAAPEGEGVSAAARKRELDRLRAMISDLDEVIARGAEAKKALAARQAQRRRFANTSGNKGKVDGMLAEALSFLSRPVGDLDADPLALNVGNGTLRFVEHQVPDAECPDPDVVRMRSEWAAELYPHARSDLISKLANVDFNPQASSPLFDAMIARILPSQAVRDYVQRYFGYCATALTREQCFALFHGEGRNGKSTLVDIIARILADYSTSIPIDSLVNSGGSKKGSEATPDLARLPGARLVRTAEPKEGIGFDESLIKGLTSSEPIAVRRLNCEFNDIYPTFKFVVSVNRKPVIKGNDDGIWRRVSLVPFDVQIPKDEVDKHLGDKMWKERTGILNWLIAGACDYLNRGKLDPPEEVVAATQGYRDESDIVATFMRSACDITKNPADSEESGRLYQSFEIWCRRNGTTPFAQTTFSRRMPKTAADLGLEKGKSSVAVYIGLRIRPEFAPRFDAPAGPHGYSVGG